ncbi:hypothetical protein ACFYOT_05125 [Saccharothrix saharensis]|uniref:hypothetical protein n=1 Tax=Saccharothrix saharensis TaxID=571190 RepID=UPI003683B1CB
MYKIRPGVLSTMGHPYGLDHIDRLAKAGVEVIVCALTEPELVELDLIDEREAAQDAASRSTGSRSRTSAYRPSRPT